MKAKPFQTMPDTKRPRVVTYLDDEDMKQGLEQLAFARSRSVSNLLLALVKAEIDRAKASGELKCQ